MMDATTLREQIRTAIECAKIYRTRRRQLAYFQLQHARRLREQLIDILATSDSYEVA
tara:strand:- start:1504 stop:1674 length:171 start_codon:yes stop_codon:yes gene_type:complete